MSGGDGVAGTAIAARAAPPRVSNADRNLRSRTAILDAARQIMREEGYAAVTSRRIAARAALGSQLVHYYFKTMDALFLALFREVETAFFARLDRAAASTRPLRAVWDVCKDVHGPRLSKEFVAMATNNAALRGEIARSADRTRAVLVAQVAQAVAASGVSPDDWPPEALAVLMDGTGRLLIADQSLGVSAGHAATIAFVERQIARLENNHAAAPGPGGDRETA